MPPDLQPVDADPCVLPLTHLLQASASHSWCSSCAYRFASSFAYSFAYRCAYS